MCSTFSKEADTFILIFGYSTFNLFPAQCTDSWSIGLLGSVHSYTVIFENGDFFSVFQKKVRSTFKSFFRIHIKTLKWCIYDNVLYRACATYDTDNLAFSKISTVGDVFKSLHFWCQKTPFTVDGRLKRSQKSPCSNKNGYEWIFFLRVDVQNDSNTLHVDTLSPDMCGRDLIISYLTNESG